MKYHENLLPSNKKFGYFFSSIFFLISIYFLYSENYNLVYIFVFLGIFLLIITIIHSDLLYPLNKIWMSFGFFLGKIINPIILGIIFFLIITPYGIIMRLFGRDELHLKKITKRSYWRHRAINTSPTNFKKQF